MRSVFVARKPEGGYRKIWTGQLMGAWLAYFTGSIELRDLRVYLACHEVVARRCGREGPNVEVGEISSMTGVKKAGAAVGRLEAAGLVVLVGHRMEFPLEDGREVPFPRRMLRHLARGGTRALIATVFGHLIRCLWLHGEECHSGGRCKASWFVKEFGIDIRSVKAARAELVALGWLVPVAEEQWAWNLWGGAYAISLTWSGSPPPPAREITLSPPPESDGEPHAGNKDQEPEDPGVSIGDVKPADLEDTARTLELHAQAVAQGLVTDCEADRLMVVAAAEHALAVGKTNPCGLFATLIRKGLRRFITQKDEVRAARRIKEHFHPAPAHVPASRPTRAPEVLTEDQAFARAFIAAAARRGYRGDPFRLLKQGRPEWTIDRWQAATR